MPDTRSNWTVAVHLAGGKSLTEQMDRYAADSARGDLDRFPPAERQKTLRTLVTNVFDLRQRVQAAKLDRARSELMTIEQRIRQRESIRDQIIDRHTAELLKKAS